jgi:DNA-binding response OmpR family regulator
MSDNVTAPRILVVEDEVLIAAEMQMILEDDGAIVVGPAHRLDRALELARSEDVDAAVLDVNLAGSQSVEVAEILDARSIPFLFVTGQSLQHIPAAFQDRDVLRKPFAEASLTAAVRKVTAGAKSCD